MSKVICDVCGTAYPETASQCPICASARNPGSQTAAGETIASGYVHTKGGHFSKKNVRKRNKGQSALKKRSNPKPAREKEDNNGSNTGLIVVVVLLLLAIAAVLIYIGIHYFGGGEENPDTTTTAPVQTPDNTEPSQSENTEPVIECEGIELSGIIVELTAEGETWQITAHVTPEDTTEELVFTSADESIATVTGDGVITAVSGGETQITVTCGNAVATCMVTCNFGDYIPGGVKVEELVFGWNTVYIDSSTGYGDTTLTSKGATWRAYKSTLNVDPSLITWVSDNENICTVENGIVTAVGSGTTKIHAQYGSLTFTCIIRCKFG